MRSTVLPVPQRKAGELVPVFDIVCTGKVKASEGCCSCEGVLYMSSCSMDSATIYMREAKDATFQFEM